MSQENNTQLKLANDFVQFTGENIFLTGKAGTGKTTFLHHIKSVSPKRMIVTAPTGVAAINAGGVTLHSFFQLPFGPQIPQNEISLPKDNNAAQTFKLNKDKINIIRSLDLLVIDEISMVRADLLDAVDLVLRRYRNKYKPFGGVQLLMIGDLHQLAPVVKDDEWDLLRKYYDTPFFFSSLALKKTNFTSIELKHIYRQNDEKFIDLLNKIRENTLDDEAINLLNSRYIPNFDAVKNSGYITLTTHNNQAQLINQQRLSQISTEKQLFIAEINGTFPEYSYPTNPELVLKVGAQVMFVKNDSSREKRFFNGKIGTVSRIDDGEVLVQCDDDEIVTTPLEWNNYSYSINEQTNEIEENVIGSFKQVPLKLAWAITIHKSQGLTFDKAIIDANAAFAHGQVYVALSRCRTFDGVVLSSKIGTSSLKNSSQISGFTQDIQQNQPDEMRLSQSKQAFEKSLLLELNDFSTIHNRVEYLLKLLKENSSILIGNPNEFTKELEQIFYSEIVEVSKKFTPQLSNLYNSLPDCANNQPLRDRLASACDYYLKKLDTIYDKFSNHFVVETDNKSVRKSIMDSYEKLLEILIQKKLCLAVGKSGFTVDKYLETRAKSTIEKAPERATKTKEVVSDDIVHPALYLALKQLRNSKAEAMGVPVYVILHQKSIGELTSKLPRSISQLETISGFGKTRIKMIGNEVISLIDRYCISNNIDTSNNIFEVIHTNIKEKKEPKIDSKLVSFELFKQGKSLAEIAQERQFVVSTIEGHLAHYVETGEIALEQLVAKEKIAQISQFYVDKEDLIASICKDALGESVSWSELKLVLAKIRKDRAIAL